MHPPRSVLLAVAGVALASTLAACAGGADDAQQDVASKNGVTTVGVAAKAGPLFRPVTIDVAEDKKIAALVPASIRKTGQLRIATSALPSTNPPLSVTGTDQRTLTGSEPDLARLVSAVLGLRPQFSNATWQNMFIGLSGGRTDVGFSNITDTEERKRKYDFATYRHDDLAFEVPKKSTLKFTGNPSVLAGRTVTVDSGTNQERILLQWQKQVRANGKDFTIRYFPDTSAVRLALASGRIDAYLAPNPTIRYHVAQGADGPSPTRVAGTYSGAGATLQGLIAATTVKGNGLAEPVRQAINKLIATGAYAKWLKAYGLSSEAVPTSQLNPPGLPLSDS